MILFYSIIQTADRSKETQEQLNSTGADRQTKSGNKWRPIHRATAHEEPELLINLVRVGALLSVSSETKNTDTP